MQGREADHPVDPIHVERWSPRAFDGSEMPDADWLTILEAARWSPSAFNAQPWRILYAKRESGDWRRFLDLLVPANQTWAANASVLVFYLSDTLMDKPNGSQAPSHSHSFDTGSAWMSMALQALRLGYHSHGMAGVDFPRVKAELGVPERFRVEAGAVFGRIADKSTLPEALQAREEPSGRKPIAEFAFAGAFRS